MPEILHHVLKSLLETNDNLTQKAKSYTPNTSTINFIILDRTAPRSLIAHLDSHNTSHTLLSIDEYLDLSQNQENLRNPTHYKEPNGLIITQKVAENNHIELTSLLSCAFINIPVIIYTNQPTLIEAISFICDGLIDYWSETSEFNDIEASLKKLLLTSKKRKYNRDLFLEIRRWIITLTTREEQVIDLLLSTKKEMTNKEIAKHLKLSPRTIEDYRANAMEKLAINTKNELVLIWLISQQLKLPLHSNQVN